MEKHDRDFYEAQYESDEEMFEPHNSEEFIKQLKKHYPNISIELASRIDTELFNKLSINFHEQSIIAFKKEKQNLYKSKKEYKEEEFSWLMQNIKELEHMHEQHHKRMVEEQRNFREGTNPPFMYKIHKKHE